MMRKQIFNLAIFCLAALSLAACKTDDEPQWDNNEVPENPGENPGGNENPGGENPGDDTPANFTAIRLNELDGNKPKFIELYNTASQPVDISGMKLRKNDEEMVYEAPSGTSIPAGGFLMLLSDQTDPSLGFNAGFSAKKSVKIELLGPDGSIVDVFANPSIAKGMVWDEGDPKYNGDATVQSYGRKPDGTGEWYILKRTQGTSNNDAAAGEKITW